MNKFREVDLPKEPDRAFEYEGSVWRVRLVLKRHQGHDVAVVSVAALNDNLSVVSHDGGFVFTEPSVMNFNHATKSGFEDNLEAAILTKIDECRRIIENNKNTDKFMKDWIG